MQRRHPIQFLRLKIRKILHLVKGPKWFPHVPVTLLVLISAVWLICSYFGDEWRALLDKMMSGNFVLDPTLLPPVLIGGGLFIMAIGLGLRSRIAWLLSLVLLMAAVVNTYFNGHNTSLSLFAYLIGVAVVLVVTWKSFDHANLAASTLFATSSIFMLFAYAIYGALYLGRQFSPAIEDVVTALYFSTVTMSTVGYGDITPQTSEAKLFTTSLIILGVAVFATSLTAVVTPLINKSMQTVVNRKANKMKRENHFVVLGDSALAQNTFKELKDRGQPVTRVLPQKPGDKPEGDPEGDIDFIIGDAADGDILKKAGCDKAIAVLAMFEDDSENAFAILAVRALGGKGRTVSAVNNPANLNRIQLVQPDVVIAPQILGGELAAMFLCGEHITGDYVIDRIFQSAGPSHMDEKGGDSKTDPATE